MQDGSPKDSFERGMAFRAKCTIFSEGCRGHLGKGLMKHFKLNAGEWKSCIRVAAKQYFKNFAKHEFSRGVY